MASKPSYLFQLPAARDTLRAEIQSFRRGSLLTDITLRVGRYDFYTHQIVIASSSPVLKARICDLEWQSTSGHILELDEQFVDFYIVEELLNYFYTAKIRLTYDHFHLIYIAAQHLQITELKLACEKVLIQIVSIDNVIYWFQLSYERNLQPFLRYTVKYILKHIEQIFRYSAPEVNDFTDEQFKILLVELNRKRNSMMVNDIMLQKVIAWVQFDRAKRIDSLTTLLRCIPLHEQSDRCLKEMFEVRLIQEAHPCAKFFLGVLERFPQQSHLYSIGTFDDASLSVCHYNRLTHTWTTLSPSRAPRTDFGGAVIGNRIYIAGGEQHLDRNFPIRTLSSFEVFDCWTESWNRLESMPQPREGCAAASLNGFVYVSGGCNSLGRPLSSVIRYDTGSDRWTEISPMNYARWGHQLVELGGRLYAIGGDVKREVTSSKPFQRSNSHPDKFTISMMIDTIKNVITSNSKQLTEFQRQESSSEINNKFTVERYDPGTDEWLPVVDTNFHHVRFGATIHRGKIYVISRAGFEVYSPQYDSWDKPESWKVLEPLPDYRGRTLMSLRGKLLAFETAEWYRDSNDSSDSGRIWCYNVQDDSWAEFTEMTGSGRYGICLFAVNPIEPKRSNVLIPLSLNLDVK